MAGIYLHIPFCKQACHYCDFHFSTDTRDRTRLLDAMCSEITLQKDYLRSQPVTSIYFGGGTPSLLSADELGGLLRHIRVQFPVDAGAEVTLEANPDDLGPEKLLALKSTGINRLSIGIQSFEDAVLKFLNRAHDSAAAFRSVAYAREAGFENISVDLIYAIPGLAGDAWLRSIQHAVDLAPSHISAYALTVEPKTAFGVWARKGKFSPVPDEIAARQSEVLTDLLEEAGFEQYEVSNYCKPAMESRHNSSYWKQEPYVGIGPSSHSYDLLTRQSNIRNNLLYMQSLERGVVPCEVETLSPTDRVNEYLLTTLRTKWGTDLEKLRREYQYDILARHRGLINTLIEQKLAILSNQILLLTRSGRLLADKITSDLFLGF